MRASIVIQQNRPIASLAQCCANGLTATVAQAETWLENHDELQRRYKEQWPTWEDACQSVYKMSRQAVHKRILKIAEHVSSTTVDKKVDYEAEESAFNQVERAREEPEPKTEPFSGCLPLDLSGCVVPKQNLSAVERRDEVREAMACASTLKSLFERIQNQPDSLFLHLKSSGSVQTFMSGAASMFSALRECLPDVVCPECGGKSASCFYCHGTGWICEVRWNRDWVKSGDSLKQIEVAKRAKNL